MRGAGRRAGGEAEPADLLINCTPVGMQGEPEWFKQLPVRADELAMFGCVVDFVYGRGETQLVRSARAHWPPAVDGRELLVAQGALSFERFTGARPPVRGDAGSRPRTMSDGTASQGSDRGRRGDRRSRTRGARRHQPAAAAVRAGS